MFGPQLSSHSSSAKQTLNPLLEVLIALPRGGDGSMKIQKGNLWLPSLPETFSPSKTGPGCKKYLQMPQKTSQENRSVVSHMTYSEIPRWTDGFAAIALLSFLLLQLKACWITWKTQQVLRKNQSFLDRSHTPERRDQSLLATMLYPIQQMIITIPLGWFSHKHKYPISEISVEAVCLGRSPKAGLALLLYSLMPLHVYSCLSRPSPGLLGPHWRNAVSIFAALVQPLQRDCFSFPFRPEQYLGCSGWPGFWQRLE